MSWLVAKMKWVMLVSGVLTLTMVQAAIAPSATLRATFGETLEGPLAEIVVRNWGALIALIGAMLIHGAFNPQVRHLVLVEAGLSKLNFITLILTFGAQYLGYQAGVASRLIQSWCCCSLRIWWPRAVQRLLPNTDRDTDSGSGNSASSNVTSLDAVRPNYCQAPLKFFAY